jgi:hypothetical protein
MCLSSKRTPGVARIEMNEDGARRAQVKGTPWFEPA